LFRDYGADTEVRNNIVSSSNTSDGKSDAPASGILIQFHPESIGPTAEPNITGNTLKGGEFDFYVTVLYPGEGGNTDNHTALVNQLVTAGFGTESSTGTLPANSFYQKLRTALLPQAKGTNGEGEGFGRLAVNRDATFNNFALEYYDIDDGKITAVNYWSPGIDDNAYTDTFTGVESKNGSGGVRGRLELQDETFTKKNVFKWTRTVTGTNLPAE
jgi:hypothetical protein